MGQKESFWEARLQFALQRSGDHGISRPLGGMLRAIHSIIYRVI